MKWLLGRRVNILPDIPVFDRKWVRSKSRFGPKFQQVKYFVKWTNLIPDGQVQCMDNNIHMGQKTWDSIERLIQTN